MNNMKDTLMQKAITGTMMFAIMIDVWAAVIMISALNDHEHVAKLYLISCIFAFASLPIWLLFFFLKDKTKTKSVETIILGHSDYSRTEIERGAPDYWTIGNTKEDVLSAIREYESYGYTITFKKKSFLQELFSIGKYKIIATKPLTQKS